MTMLGLNRLKGHKTSQLQLHVRTERLLQLNVEFWGIPQFVKFCSDAIDVHLIAL